MEQTYPYWECIIVNDGSPDNTKEVAKFWCEKDTRFQYLEKQNGGLSSARNAGINISSGEFILPLDADDVLHPDYLITLVPELENGKNLAIVTCYSKFFVNTTSNIIHELKPVGTTYHAMLFENCIIATSLYRKKCWEDVGGYDENMKNGFEDWEFWIAILKRNWTYKVVEEFLFYYRKAEKSMLIDTLKNHRTSNMEYVLNKHKEVYKGRFDNTMEYLFFLLKRNQNTLIKTKASREFIIGSAIMKPFRLISRTFNAMFK